MHVGVGGQGLLGNDPLCKPLAGLAFRNSRVAAMLYFGQ